MKKIFGLIFCWCFAVNSFTQVPNSGIAPFKIEQVNGKDVTYQNLKKNTLTVLVYFSPTCDHCKKFTTQLLKHEKEIANKQFVMVTYVPVDELKPFTKEFNMNSRKNFIVGTEGSSFIVQKFYKVQRFPFVALYDKQNHLKKILPYQEDPSPTIAEILKLN